MDLCTNATCVKTDMVLALQNGSQFFVLFNPQPHLDGKHVVFGELVAGFTVLQGLENIGSNSGTPQTAVVVKVGFQW